MVHNFDSAGPASNLRFLPRASDDSSFRLPPSKWNFAQDSFHSEDYIRFDEKPSRIREFSVRLPQLRQREKEFFELVQANDVPAVQEFLQRNRGFDINCVNFQSVSALQTAVYNGFEAMVALLLNRKGVDIGDCLLYAIRNNQIGILKLLLEKMQKIAPGLEFVGPTHSCVFPDYITPLILAAQCGHLEIMRILVERGHTIQKPHLPNCRCKDCSTRLDRDEVRDEILRLNVYKAISNPTYICLSSADPILTAFELSRDLTLCSGLAHEFYATYLALAQQVSNFAVELISCCRNTKEMDMILKQRGGERQPCHFIYPRLVMAMDCKQKRFVAHPHTQLMIEIVWCGDFYEWKFKSLPVKFMYPFFRLILLPIVLVFCLILPKHRLVKHFSIPVNKMLSKIGAYLVFLLLIFLETNGSKIDMKRGPPNSGLEPVIVLFVFSIIMHSVRICLLKGPARYFSKIWNWFDILMYILYILTFLFWILSAIDVEENDQVDLDRKFWNSLDPTLLAEGTFAIAVVMSYFRLLHLVRLHYAIGPLHVCMGSMCRVCVKYLLIFALAVLSFSCGTCKLYHYYDGMVQTDEETDARKTQATSFVDFFSTLKTYFWGLFTMSDLASADIVIDVLPGAVETKPIINEHTFTQTIGYIAFGVFEVLTVIILKQMLVASLHHSFEAVVDHKNEDWAFGRTAFYIDYMDHAILPPPLNLVPTAHGLSLALEWVQVLRKKLPDRKACFKFANWCFIEREADEHVTQSYSLLMQQLVQRYLRVKVLTNQNKEREIESLRREIGEIKFLLRESLTPR